MNDRDFNLMKDTYEKYHPRASFDPDEQPVVIRSNRMDIYWVDRYLEQLESRLSESAIQQYRRILVQLFRFMNGGNDLATVTEEKMRVILDYIRRQKKASGVYQWAYVCKGFFDYCVSMGVRSDNPMADINVSNPNYTPKRKKPKEQKEITKPDAAVIKSTAEQLMAVLDGCGLKTQAIIALILTTNIRISVLQRMTIGGYSPRSREVKVNEDKVELLNDQAAHILASYISALYDDQSVKNDTLLFINEQDQPLSRQRIWGIMRDEMRKAGIQGIMPGCLRGALTG